MLWNAPIWLNEMLVAVIKFLVELLPFICIISAGGLIYSIICILRNKGSLRYSIKDKKILFPLGGLLVSCIGLILFYLPQQVMHDSYSFDEISIRIHGSSSESERITIRDKEELEEFKRIFSGQICSRSLDSGSTIIDSDTVYVDFTVFDIDKVFPIHFIVSQGNLRRYTAANTDFIYTVKDDEHILADKVFRYAEKHIEAAEVDNNASNGSDSITRIAWETINRDITNYESNPVVNILDSKITRLEIIETFDSLADTTIDVYALEFRLLPEDLSKVVLAGGMDVDEEGWLKETCSMGSPLLVIKHNGGEVEFIGTLWTGGVLEEGGLEASIQALLERN
ncbi:MAG TPA: hypothetical protein VEB00_02845 [Clostridia bacterium]|nr:hypothetical protein [Clostridia bacterium]